MKRKCRYDKTNWQIAIGKLANWQVLLIAYCLFAIFPGCGEKKQEQQLQTSNSKLQTVYYCPMHPEVQQDHPGKCPKCGMELVLKASEGLLENVLKPVNSTVLASVKTIKPVFHKMNMDVETNGYIEYDKRTEHDISTLFSGRIEKLYIRYPYQPVRKGEKIFEIYSPELVTAQENLVYLFNNDSGETSLINSAKQKLKLLGLSDILIEKIVSTKTVMHSIPVFSPYEGHVHEMKSSTSGMKSMSSGMGTNNISGEELSVKEGMYVMMGETVFNVINPHDVVVMLQINPEDISKIKVGAEVKMTIDGNNGMTMTGKIDFIEPVFKAGFKTMTARVNMDNHLHNHKVGSLVKAKIKGKEMEALWIPISALVDLGKEKIVWVKKEELFTARKVETGAMSNTMVEISDGLIEEDEIASEAHYLVDSEGFIKTENNEE
ncbi:MAG TPA: HlyD family efflux transporter periplasmic adaptor subunit [Bacteroidia bacterium]|nr:HlyD family efflux transporter periplasmic adaptor subunit [Bacteroidia bacterium]